MANKTTSAAKAAKKSPSRKKKSVAKKAPAKPVLLSGGNPQIAKGYGEAPVRAYIAAMPGWKRDVGRQLHAIIARAVPGVRKAVKYNSPMYGLEDDLWFLSYHCFAKYVKVAFFRGASLRPMPAGTSKQKQVRYLDIYEDDGIDEDQFADWVKQASRLPGERLKLRAEIDHFFDAWFRATASRISFLNADSLILSPSRMSMARRAFPSRLELKSDFGSGSDAPFMNVSFTTPLYDSPVQMIPS
jgi:hypothetical protein